MLRLGVLLLLMLAVAAAVWRRSEFEVYELRMEHGADACKMVVIEDEWYSRMDAAGIDVLHAIQFARHDGEVLGRGSGHRSTTRTVRQSVFSEKQFHLQVDRNPSPRVELQPEEAGVVQHDFLFAVLDAKGARVEVRRSGFDRRRVHGLVRKGEQGATGRDCSAETAVAVRLTVGGILEQVVGQRNLVLA